MTDILATFILTYTIFNFFTVRNTLRMKSIYFAFQLVWITSLFPQNNTINEKLLFESGVQAYRSRSYTESKNSLEKLIAQYPEGAYYTAGLLMLSKTYQQMQLIERSIIKANQIIESYPKSAYADDALFQRARGYYLVNRFVSSCKDLILLKKQTSEKKLSLRADSLIALIVKNNLLTEEIRDLLVEETDTGINAVLQSQYLTNLLAQKRYEHANKALEFFLKKETSATRTKIYRDLLKQIEANEEGPVRIGCIISLSGTNSEVGRSIKAGIELAIHRHNRSNMPRIELVLYDDQSDIIQTIQAARELASDDGISAIIGPIESTTMAAAAVIADQHRIPIISPTATQSGLTQIGSFVYQANMNIESRSEAIARYAVDELGFKKFAILSPSDSYGDIAATSFARTVEKLGGKVIVIEKFYENTSDYKGQLVHLRKMGFIERAIPQTSYRLLSKLTSPQIDSIYAQYYPIDSASTESEYNKPMDFIDALFLPVYTDDIKYIAPQLAFYNIKTQLLGSDNWYDLTELRLHQNYVNGVMFVSESYMDPTDPDVKSFNEAFKKINGVLPLREAAYGYDLMNLITSLIESGNYTSEEIQSELKKGITWNGIHNKIVFTKESRVNASVHILRFSDGKIKKLSD